MKSALPSHPASRGWLGFVLCPAQKDGIQAGLSPRDLELPDVGLERSWSVLSTPQCLCSTLRKCKIELLMALTPFPYIPQSPGLWSPHPHSQLQFNWSQQEGGAGMFLLLKHCPWWWNDTKALEQVSGVNSNPWHFEHSFVFPAKMLLASFGSSL